MIMLVFGTSRGEIKIFVQNDRAAIALLQRPPGNFLFMQDCSVADVAFWNEWSYEFTDGSVVIHPFRKRKAKLEHTFKIKEAVIHDD